MGESPHLLLERETPLFTSSAPEIQSAARASCSSSPFLSLTPHFRLFHIPYSD